MKKEKMKKAEQLAWQQLDWLIHSDGYYNLDDCIFFEYEGKKIFDPWLDKNQENIVFMPPEHDCDSAVNPYEYYGKELADDYIERILKQEEQMADNLISVSCKYSVLENKTLISETELSILNGDTTIFRYRFWSDAETESIELLDGYGNRIETLVQPLSDALCLDTGINIMCKDLEERGYALSLPKGFEEKMLWNPEKKTEKQEKKKEAYVREKGKHKERTENQRIAQETLQITKNGYYDLEDKRITFEYEPEYYQEVHVFDPGVVEDIEDDEEEYFEHDFCKYEYCEYRVENMDSFEATRLYASHDRALVLNFANAHRPGGGFINGASAQEESLCRCSTLYASLNSGKAKEMYEFNNENKDAFDSDYMLISPYVEVFRKANGSLMDFSFNTAVLTIPAPNLNGLASNVKKDILDQVMREKIRSFLMVSAKMEYDTLVLGAWGCGAFGHDAADVAGYFKQIFDEEKYYQFFKSVVFAVYDKSKEKYNLNCFLDAFGTHGIWKNEDCEAAIITAEYKENTYDEEGSQICFSDITTENVEDTNSIIDMYLKNKDVVKIEIIK